MNESDCMREVAKLIAAFPSKNVTDDTAAVYCESLVGLRHAGALQAAVSSLLRSERWLPSIAAIIEEYHRYSDRFAPAALPEPELSQEQRAANVERAREMQSRLKGVEE